MQVGQEWEEPGGLMACQRALSHANTDLGEKFFFLWLLQLNQSSFLMQVQKPSENYFS